MRALLLVCICSVTLAAQQAGGPLVTNQDLLAGLPNDGSKWLIHHGNYFGHRYSPLTQITPENVNQLKAQWTFQTTLGPSFQTTPLFVDNVLYVTGVSGNAWAIDARTGRQIWRYRRNMPGDVQGGSQNRGFAAHGDKLFLGTSDAHLVALDMKTGDVIWDVELADYKKRYSVTVAPLVVKDKVIIGPAGAEYGIRGFIDAFDVNTGKKAWRFYTVRPRAEPRVLRHG
jgi:alcohol dehydrogenase (cytochrome c)